MPAKKKGGLKLPVPAASAARSETSAGSVEMADWRPRVLELLARGGSPASVCTAAGIDVQVFRGVVETEPAFRAAMYEVGLELVENVTAALYVAAMKGSVPAATLFLRGRGGPEWGRTDPVGSGGKLENLSDAELFDRARELGIGPAGGSA